MYELNFCKFSPGGNPTILVTASRIEAAERLPLSLQLLHPLHLQAEQVGFVDVTATPPHLDMMGGEFCLNASRCLAFEAARRNRFLPLAYTDDVFGLISCSGMSVPLQVRIKDGKTALNKLKNLSAKAGHPVPASSGEISDCPAQANLKTRSGHTITQLECFILLECNLDEAGGETNIQTIAKGAVLVRLPGITHLLLDENWHPQPVDFAAEAAAWRNRLGLENEAASGVVWHGDIGSNAAKKTNNQTSKSGISKLNTRLQNETVNTNHKVLETVCHKRITPLVHVAETGTSILESACGSASLALGLATVCGALTANIQVKSDTALNDITLTVTTQTETIQTDNESLTNENDLFRMTVTQPSGEDLKLLITKAGKTDYAKSYQVEIGGLVRLVAEGRAFVD